MTQVSPNVVWSIIRKNNCYVQRRNGRTKRSGAVALSGETGNLRNKHSFKSSGLANKDAVGVSGDDKITLYIRKSENGKKPRTEFEEAPLTIAFKSGVALIKSKTQDSYYRRDLTKAALARFALEKRANSVAQGGKKGGVQKTGRK